MQKNREILCELLPQKPLELINPHQTHSTNIGVIDDACIRANKENRLEDIDAIMRGENPFGFGIKHLGKPLHFEFKGCVGTHQADACHTLR